MADLITANRLSRRPDVKYLLVVVVNGSSVEFGLNRELLGRLSLLDRYQIAKALKQIYEQDFKQGVIL